MRLTFSFAGLPEIPFTEDELAIYRTQFDFPDEVATIPNYQAHLSAIVTLIGRLTVASMSVTCAPLGWHDESIVCNDDEDGRGEAWNAVVIGFEQLTNGERVKFRYLKVLFAVFPPFHSDYFRPTRKAPTRRAMAHHFPIADESQQIYLGMIDQIVAHCLFLLNQHPTQEWQAMGFHPYWVDKGVGKEVSRRVSAMIRMQEAEMKGTTITPDEALSTGMIYFLQQGENGLIHISYVTNPNKHLRELNANSPYPIQFIKIINGNERFEQVIHHQFSAYRVDDKWFLPAEDLLNFIASLDQC